MYRLKQPRETSGTVRSLMFGWSSSRGVWNTLAQRDSKPFCWSAQEPLFGPLGVGSNLSAVAGNIHLQLDKVVAQQMWSVVNTPPYDSSRFVNWDTIQQKSKTRQRNRSYIAPQATKYCSCSGAVRHRAGVQPSPCPSSRNLASSHTAIRGHSPPFNGLQPVIRVIRSVTTRLNTDSGDGRLSWLYSWLTHSGQFTGQPNLRNYTRIATSRIRYVQLYTSRLTKVDLEC